MVPAARSGPVRPAAPGRAEPALVRWRVRAVAVVALVATLAYLGWRTLATLDASVASLALLALEAHAALRLGLLAFSLWDLDAVPDGPPPPDAARGQASVPRRDGLRPAVLVPVGTEPVELLLPTVASAVALEPAHDTWVVDQGDRPEVRRLALDLGARYGAAPGHPETINQALEMVGADLVAVLTPGYVAEAGLLSGTLGYFEDPRLAVVQGSLDSFDGAPEVGVARWRTEEAFVHRLLQPGRNRWRAAQWCGPGAVLRAGALRDIGGVVDGTPAPELSTTIRLHRRGWRSLHHPEVLARSLAAPDAGRYRQERARRYAGAVSALWTENPLFGRGLRPTQRLAYAAYMFGWLDSWRALGHLLVPLAVLLSGAVPIRADAATFAIAFVVIFCLQRLAVLELVRDRLPNALSPVADLVRMPSDLWATLSMLCSVQARPSAHRGRFGAAAVLYLLQWTGGLAGGFAAASFVRLTPVHYREIWVACGAVGWVALNGALLMRAVGQLRGEAAYAERRASVRFDVELTGLLGDYRCDIVSLSLIGAGVRLPVAVAGEIEVGDEGALGFDLGGTQELEVVVRSLRLRPDQTLDVGVEFRTGQQGERARLALALFQSETPASLVHELPGGSGVSPGMTAGSGVSPGMTAGSGVSPGVTAA